MSDSWLIKCVHPWALSWHSTSGISSLPPSPETAQGAQLPRWGGEWEAPGWKPQAQELNQFACCFPCSPFLPGLSLGIEQNKLHNMLRAPWRPGGAGPAHAMCSDMPVRYSIQLLPPPSLKQPLPYSNSPKCQIDMNFTLIKDTATSSPSVSVSRCCFH